jgi:hypothetical protein
MVVPTVTVNLSVTAAGFQPTPPATINANFINYVSQIQPGFTANLPASLIEDLTSTATGAIVQVDSLCVELGNSISPYSANSWIMTQLGNIYGVQQGADTNTSVFVVFNGTVGFSIPPGFTIGDGTYQYVIQEGSVIPVGGVSAPIFCLANTTGSWAVPSNTVTQIITSVPSGVTLSVNNPNTGTPGALAQSLPDYQAQVIQAGLAAAQGMPTFLKTLLSQVPGVQQRLVAAVQIGGGGWEIIVGGGDPYQVANAIYSAMFDFSILVGSTLNITGITRANPGVVTTNLNHGLTTGQTNVYISGVLGMTAANGGPYTVTVLSPTTFSFGVNTTAFGTYTSGGVVTPNNRNVSVNLIDYPDTYTIPFVNPPQQTTIIQLQWHTISPNYVSPSSIVQLGTPAIVGYVNSIPVGQPLNGFDLEDAFQNAIESVLDISYLANLVLTVTVNGVAITPTGYLYYGDPESYFYTTSSNVTITQI